MGWSTYGKPVDIWSIGTILAELLIRRPLFAGSNSEEQLELITNTIGSPSEHLVKKAKKSAMKKYLQKMDNKDKTATGLKSLIPENKASNDAVDILSKMITFDPAERWTVQELLKHPYVASERAA